MTPSRFHAAGPLKGSLRPPPDKSISHRAAILGAMADGRSRIEGYLDSADTRSTLEAVRTLGAGVEVEPGGDGSLTVEIDGIGLRGPGRGAGSGPSVAIDVGNAGTLLRLLPGWLAGQEGGSWSLSGDESIARRPVGRVADPLGLMGADLTSDDGTPPLDVSGASLRGIDYELPVASAQVKSCLLLAGLLADGPTSVTEPEPTRDHTERMLRAAGAKLRVETVGPGLTLRGSLPPRRVTVEPTDSLRPVGFSVPGDLSSAAFFIVAALVIPGSSVRLEGVGLNPTRIGLLGILNRMGALIEVEEQPPVGGEPRGAITARYSRLHGTRVSAGEVPLAIDELPMVALAGCFADGETVISGAEELRHKESDRIATVVEALRGIGAGAEAFEDGFAVRGTGPVRGGVVHSYGDHRLAMLGAVAGLASREGVEVEGMDAASVSYPGFESDLASLTTRD